MCVCSGSASQICHWIPSFPLYHLIIQAKSGEQYRKWSHKKTANIWEWNEKAIGVLVQMQIFVGVFALSLSFSNPPPLILSFSSVLFLQIFKMKNKSLGARICRGAKLVLAIRGLACKELNCQTSSYSTFRFSFTWHTNLYKIKMLDEKRRFVFNNYSGTDFLSFFGGDIAFWFVLNRVYFVNGGHQITIFLKWIELYSYERSNRFWSNYRAPIFRHICFCHIA